MHSWKSSAGKVEITTQVQSKIDSSSDVTSVNLPGTFENQISTTVSNDISSHRDCTTGRFPSDCQTLSLAPRTDSSPLFSGTSTNEFRTPAPTFHRFLPSPRRHEFTSTSFPSSSEVVSSVISSSCHLNSSRFSSLYSHPHSGVIFSSSPASSSFPSSFHSPSIPLHHYHLPPFQANALGRWESNPRVGYPLQPSSTQSVDSVRDQETSQTSSANHRFCPRHHFYPTFSPPQFLAPKVGGEFSSPIEKVPSISTVPSPTPVQFYPIFLCRNPNGDLEPIHIFPNYHQHYPHQDHRQDSFNHSYHHHHHPHLIDSNCPIHGCYFTQQSGDDGDTNGKSSCPLHIASSSSSLSSSLSVINIFSSSSPSVPCVLHHPNHHLQQQKPSHLYHPRASTHNNEGFFDGEESTSKHERFLVIDDNDFNDEIAMSFDQPMNGDVLKGQRALVESLDASVETTTTTITTTTISKINSCDDDSHPIYPTSRTPPERDLSCNNLEKPNLEDESETKNQKIPREIGGMAFTIDFGNDKDQPEISDKWKKLVPYKVHAGIKERQEEQKRRRMSKEITAELKRTEQMKKSRSHSGYMSEGHDASSIVSSDIEDASICSDFVFQEGPRYSSPKRLVTRDKRPSSSSKCQTPRTTNRTIQDKKVTRSAPPPISFTRTTSVTRVTRAAEKIPANDLKKNTKMPKDKELKGARIRRSESSDPRQTTRPANNSTKMIKTGKSTPQRRISGVIESSFDSDVAGTAYLIKKMLNDTPSSSDPSYSSAKILGSPGIARRLKMGMKQARDVDGDDDDEEGGGGRGRPPSESGTYTIDDEEDEDGKDLGEVVKARKKIDEAFGVVCKLPVIDDLHGDDRVVRTSVKKSASQKTTPTTKRKVSKGEKLEPDTETKAPPSPTKLKSSAVRNKESTMSKDEEKVSPVCSIEREDSFERLMNETSSRLNALIDATSQVIRDAKFAVKTEPQKVSSATFVRPRKSTGNATSKAGYQEGNKEPHEGNSGFFVVSCDTPATRKTKSISSSCEAGSIRAKSPPSSDIHLSTHSVSEVEEVPMSVMNKIMTGSLVSRRGKSADVKSNSTSREALKFRDVFNVTPTSSGNVDKKGAKKFVPPFAKSLCNVSQPGPSKEGTTFIRDVALIRDMVENVSGGSGRVKSALGRQASATSTPSVAPSSSLRTNRTFALRCSSKAAPTGAAEVPGRSSSARHPTRSRSVGNGDGGKLKSRESSRNRLDSQQMSRSQRQQHPAVSPVSDVLTRSDARLRLSSGTQDRDIEPKTSAFFRKDGGRFSMRVEKSDSGSKKNLEAPTNAWQRRKNYDPRKSADISRSRSSPTRRIDAEIPHKTSRDLGQIPSKAGASVPPGKKLDKIARMSHAVADNINTLTKNSDLEMPTPLKQLPVFKHDSPSSAFSTCTVNKNRPIRSQDADLSPTDLSPYDSVLVDSIQQVSKKVKSLADVLIGRMRDDCTFEDDSPRARRLSNSPDSSPIWQNANPELAAILENLKRTELHLQEVHKTLFSDPNEPVASTAGPLPNSPHLARKAGFIPIEKAHHGCEEEDEDDEDETDFCCSSPAFTPSLRRNFAAETSKRTILTSKTSEIKKTSSSASMATANRKKVTPFKSTNHNPLSGDEYY